MEEATERVAADERVGDLALMHAENDQLNRRNLEVTTLPRRKVLTTK